MRTGHVARDWLLVKRSCLRRSSGGGQVVLSPAALATGHAY